MKIVLFYIMIDKKSINGGGGYFYFRKFLYEYSRMCVFFMGWIFLGLGMRLFMGYFRYLGIFITMCRVTTLFNIIIKS